MLAAAFGSGIRYYDSAPAYAGSERYLGLFWQEHPERVKGTFQTSKSAQRDASGASETLPGRSHAWGGTTSASGRSMM